MVSSQRTTTLRNQIGMRNLVAIGGINAETLPPVLAAGARNFAVVRAVCQSLDPYSAIRKLVEIHA